MTLAPYLIPSIEPHYCIAVPVDDQLAPRLTRLVAAIIDIVLVSLFTILGGSYWEVRGQQGELIEVIAMMFVGFMLMVALSGYLVATRGQTLAKLLFRIQIVDAETGYLLPFSRAYILRYFWPVPLAIIVPFILGSIGDVIFNLVIMVGLLLIFGCERRCLHDHIAGSKVVMHVANRPKMSRITAQSQIAKKKDRTMRCTEDA